MTPVRFRLHRYLIQRRYQIEGWYGWRFAIRRERSAWRLSKSMTYRMTFR